MIFFPKKLRYLKSRISTKFHHLLFIFYFLAFLAFIFYISPIQTCRKTMEFFIMFYSKDLKFYQRILEISNSSFTKIEICEISFFVFLLFLKFTFQSRLFELGNKFWKIYMFFYFMD